MDQIELYRETRESIMQGLDVEAWNSMPYAARDRALLAELKAENNLHPALYPAEDSTEILGHFKASPVLASKCSPSAGYEIRMLTNAEDKSCDVLLMVQGSSTTAGFSLCEEKNSNTGAQCAESEPSVNELQVIQTMCEGNCGLPHGAQRPCKGHDAIRGQGIAGHMCVQGSHGAHHTLQH